MTDEDGNVTEETRTVERIRLIIVISGKTAEEMAAEYEFNEEQLSYLAELLSEEYEELWHDLPCGGSDDIVEVALLQVGNVGGEPYVETMAALEAIDDGTLSDEEAIYYAEVTLRINQKLLEVV